MHIPDHYLSPSTCAVLGVAMMPVWIKSVNKVKQEIPKEKLPLLGVGTAFSFLIMMFNVPLPGGTTGHGVGAVLLAIILGPYSACACVSAALLIQALLFGDGGILAFGANCFNMAFIMPFSGYYIYNFINNRWKNKKAQYAGIALGSYIGLNLAALCAAVQFGIQPSLFTNMANQPLYCPYPLSVSIPAMMMPHLAVAGLLEAVITMATISFAKKVSPDLFCSSRKIKLNPAYKLIACLICLSPVGLLAPGTAWGEWGLDEIKNVVSNGHILGYIPEGMQQGFIFETMIPDYSVNGFPDAAAYIFSAAIGTLIAIAFFKIIEAIAKNYYATKVGEW
ncbi:cobalt transporter CbiM [Oscillospiraceae bacterium LTW-04]|nr:cobalt transporter CbiM [Oscillospiraceae bacterium MB24-C1]